jgi:hypothetical protein
MVMASLVSGAEKQGERGERIGSLTASFTALFRTDWRFVTTAPKVTTRRVSIRTTCSSEVIATTWLIVFARGDTPASVDRFQESFRTRRD